MALTFFWRCEGTILDGTDDFTAGDNSATAVSAVEISAAAARVGTNGINTPTGNDYYRFDAASILSTAQGAVGFSLRLNPLGDGTIIFRAFGTSANDQLAVEVTATNELLFRHRVNAAGNLTLPTTAVNLATSTWYGVVVRWHAANDDRRIEVYDSTGTLIEAVEDLSTAFGPQTDLITMEFGTNGGLARVHIDNIFVADDYAEPIENFFTITSYTEYGAGGDPKGSLIAGKLLRGGLLLHGVLGR